MSEKVVIGRIGGVVTLRLRVDVGVGVIETLTMKLNANEALSVGRKLEEEARKSEKWELVTSDAGGRSPTNEEGRNEMEETIHLTLGVTAARELLDELARSDERDLDSKCTDLLIALAAGLAERELETLLDRKRTELDTELGQILRDRTSKLLSDAAVRGSRR